MTSEDAILNMWLRRSPPWLTDIYLNCLTVNRIMKECALLETSKEEMLLKLVKALYEQRNQWRDTALHLKQYEPGHYYLSKIDPITTQLASTEDAENDRLYDQWNDGTKLKR